MNMKQRLDALEKQVTTLIEWCESLGNSVDTIEDTLEDTLEKTNLDDYLR